MEEKERWRKGGFKGDIKKYDLEPHAPETYENLDDYDIRHGFGGRFAVVKSRFAMEE